MDTLVGHMAGVSCLAWSPDSKTLATGSDDKAIRLWDRVTGSPAYACGADDGSRGRVRRAGTGPRLGGGRKPLLGHHNYVYCLAFSPKGNILASGSYDEAVFLWDVRAGRMMRTLPAHSDPVSGIDFCRDGSLVASCSTDGLIRIWDTSTGQCLRTLVYEDSPAAACVCFSPNGRYVLASYLDSCLRMWDFISMPSTVKKTYQGHTNKGFSIGGCFGQLGDRPFVASASEDGDVVLWDVRSKAIIQRIERAHDGVCFGVHVHGETLVTAGQDGKVVVFRHKGKINEVNGHLSPSPSVDGERRSPEVEAGPEPVVAAYNGEDDSDDEISFV
ncbi:WD repeat-containing protein 5 [Pleurostoma richardsiae]|uniref:Mitochondrial division protein 1 n=1 Tax=Pleurostoma richardsiae TaxID=41990 RepID=A0AA38SE36_9PEZI|nr:WD repeat-containing protein 5 [Pleurostoma richardsiae]